MTGSRHKTLFISLSLVIAALSVAACGGGSGTAQTSPPASSSGSGGRSATVSVANSVLGQILVDAQGRTLYLFKADSRGTSACDGACAASWPPLLAHGNPVVGGGADRSLVSTIARPTGARQLTYNGHPLYLYVGDQKSGDVNGQGVTAFGAPWYALSPNGRQLTTSPSGSGASAGSPGGVGY